MTFHTIHIDNDVRTDDQIAGHSRVGLSQPEPFLGRLGFIGALDRPVGDSGSAEAPVPGSAAAVGSAGRQPGAGHRSGQ